MKLIEIINLRIEQLCAEYGINLNKLCNLSGVNPSTIGNFKKANTYKKERNDGVNITTIKKLCDGLNITLRNFFNSELFFDTNLISEELIKSIEKTIKTNKLNKKNETLSFISIDDKVEKINTITAINLRIDELRENKSISEICRLSKVNRSNLGNMRSRGDSGINIVILEKICNGLNISLKDFFDNDLFDNLEQEIK